MQIRNPINMSFSTGHWASRPSFVAGRLARRGAILLMALLSMLVPHGACAAGTTPVLQGVLVIAGSGNAHANLKLGETGRPEWVSVGGTFAGYRVEEVQADRVVLSAPEAERLVVYLHDAQNRSAETGEPPGPSAAPAFGTPDWINSRLNPMVHQPIQLPIEISMRWTELSAEERMEVVKWYQAHGWNMNVETSGGYFGVS
jgi:hypothetical protein